MQGSPGQSAKPSPQLDLSLPALVVRVGHSPLLNHGALGAVRSLGRLGVPVHALIEDRRAPIAASRHLAGSLVWPVTGGEDSDVLVGRLRRLCARRGPTPAVAVPTSDEAAVLLAEHRDELADVLRQPEVAPDLPRRLVDKYAMFELCSDLSLPTPRAFVAESPAEFADAVGQLGLPVVVKNADLAGRLGNPAVSTTKKLSTPQDVEALATALERGGFKRLLVQEFVPEEESPQQGSDWFAHVYRASDGAVPLVFTGRKLHNWPPGGGVTARGVAVANPRLGELAEHVCRSLDYRGIGDMDWRYDPRDDTYKLVDFNPRLGAQAQLFTTPDGLDLVRALHLDLSGRPVPPGRQVDGRELLVEHLDAAATFVELRQRVKEARVRARSGNGARDPAPTITHREPAWFAWDDPLPFVVVTVRFLRNIAVKSLKRGRTAVTRRCR
jgi:D-aspartate ligase